MPVGRIIPFESIDNRVEADAFERHASLGGDDHFVGELAYPRGSPRSDVARLADDDRALIAFIGALEQTVEGHPATVSGLDMPVDLLPAGHFPLIVVVEVHAEDIQIALAAAQLWSHAAGDHVPRFPLTVVLGV